MNEDYGLSEFHKSLDLYLAENPTTCPDCGENLLITTGKIEDCFYADHLSKCPKCGWEKGVNRE